MKSRDDDRVERYLASLPQAAPRAALAEQLLRRHARRRQWRRHAPWALAAGLLLGIQILRAPMPTPMDARPAPAAGAEQAWAEVRALDRRLQVAYVEGRSQAQLERLWRQREAAIASHAQGAAAGLRPVRL